MLKKILLAFLGLILVLSIIIGTILASTGFFREIDNKFEGNLAYQVELPGVEDLAISYEDHFLLLSSDDRASRRDGKPQQGGIYYLDLQDPSQQPKLISQTFDKQLYPHGISMLKLDSAFHLVLVVNHVGEHSVSSSADQSTVKHYIEVFHLYGDSLVFQKRLEHPLIKSPNDVIALDKDRFYFTNDHGATSALGRFGEDYLGVALSNVVYFDGTDYKIVAEDIAYANGINYDTDRNLLFVASPRDFLVKVYETQTNGDLQFVEDIDCGTGVDNIEFDQDGNIWIGCHPNLIHFTTYASGQTQYAPSEIIRIDYRSKGDYTVESVFLSNGEDMSASTVAIKYNDLIFTGNVMDSKAIVLKQTSP